MQGSIWTWELLDKSDAAFRKLGQKFRGMDSLVDDLDTKGTKLGKNLKRSFREAADEIPGLSRGLMLMKNPIVLGAAAVVGIGKAMHHATQKASEFNHEFLELKNLNLDKTQSQIDNLKKSVLDLAFEKGLDPMKTSKAFFDVQSATGKYGAEVEQIVGKVGKFAQVMKADFNTSIEGASKAMGIFNFGADKMDEFLASNFKTVQVGVTTFDQLATVQTEYAKSAASAGQGFNEANKLFAVFSANEKNVDIAATKTKGAFEDLTKKSTIKGFKKLGVEIFDSAGHTKKLDDIVKELVPKLKGMSDTRFSALKEEIGGNEGLRGLLDTLKGSGDKVLDTFKSFNDTELGWKKALENANGDVKTMSSIIDNKLTTAWIKFGEAITPILIKIKGFAIDILDLATKLADSYNYTADGWESKKEEDRANKVKSIEEGRTGDGALVEYIRRQGKGFNLDNFIDKYDNNPQNLAAFISQNTFSEAERKKLIFNTKNGKPFSDAFKNSLESEFNSISISRMNGLSLDQILGYRKGIGLINNPKGTNTDLDLNAGGNKEGSSNPIAAGIMGAADKVRNVTVNIQSLVQDFVVNKEGGSLNPEDIMRVVEEALVRAVHDAELVLSE